MRPARAIAIILGAAAVATFGLDRFGGELRSAAADHPLDGHFDALMPRYPRASEFPMGEGIEAGSGELRMSYFSTDDPPLRVARYYRTVWELDGLAVHESITPEGGVVGTFDPRIGAARSVTILTARGRTWAFPSVVERPVDAVGPGDLGRAEGLPVFPGSATGLTLRSTDGAAGANVVTTYSNDGGLEENLAFYRRELAGEGWVERETRSFDELEGHRALEFVRGDRELFVNVTPVGEEDGDRVVVCVILGARR